MSSKLQEIVLSSTCSSSPIPSTLLHSLETGSQLFQFKSSASTASTSKPSTSVDDKEQQTLNDRKTTTFVQTSSNLSSSSNMANSGSGFLLSLGGKDGRSGINLWSLQRESILSKLIPPIRLTTITLSHAGQYLVGGTLDGRIFFWEVSSGSLLLTIDAHYRSISVIEFTNDDAALISASEDSGVSVWSVGRLLNASLLNPPTPFATLSDHTLPITSIAIGLGSFPKCRILTSSLDSTVKIWDISTSPSILLATFSFPHPIHLVAWDPLERFFFASGPDPAKPVNHRVVKVPLYLKKPTTAGFEATEPLVGNDESSGRVQNVVEKMMYSIPERITSLHLSSHSPTLLVGTSTCQIHILSLPSLLPTRLIPPPPTTTPPGPITFLTTLLRPFELGNAPGGGASGEKDFLKTSLFKNGLGRTSSLNSGEEFLKGGVNGRLIESRIEANEDVADWVRLPLPVHEKEVGSGREQEGSDRSAAVVRVSELEAEVERLKAQLGKAVQLNEGMWKKIVEGSLTGGTAKET